MEIQAFHCARESRFQSYVSQVQNRGNFKWMTQNNRDNISFLGKIFNGVPSRRRDFVFKTSYWYQKTIESQINPRNEMKGWNEDWKKKTNSLVSMSTAHKARVYFIDYFHQKSNKLKIIWPNSRAMMSLISALFQLDSSCLAICESMWTAYDDFQERKNQGH